MSRVLTGWRIDTSASTAEFTVRNFGLHLVRGRVPIAHGLVEPDPTGQPRTVTGALDLAAIDTGNHRRDVDLAKPRLLDTGRFPELRFTGRISQENDAARWQVPGILSARGAAVDVVLDVEATPTEEGVRARATTSFDRRALGIRAPRAVVGRQVRVVIEVVLRPVP